MLRSLTPKRRKLIEPRALVGGFWLQVLEGGIYTFLGLQTCSLDKQRRRSPAVLCDVQRGEHLLL